MLPTVSRLDSYNNIASNYSILQLFIDTYKKLISKYISELDSRPECRYILAQSFYKRGSVDLPYAGS